MVTTVYIDSLFALNAIINYLLLVVSARLCDLPVKRWRMLLGAVLGGVYAVVVFLPPFHFLMSLLCKGIVALLMSLIAAGGVAWRRFVKYTLVFLGVSFATGGAVMALGAVTGQMGVRNGAAMTSIHMPTLILGFGVCYLILTLVFRRSARHGGLSHDVAAVEVVSEGRTVRFSALLDSGNTLTDPLTGAPVMIVEPEKLCSLWPPACRSLIDRRALRDPTALLSQLHEIGMGARFRLVPYRAVGTAAGFLLTYRPDYVAVADKVQKRLLTALSPEPLSDGAAFSAIVGV